MESNKVISARGENTVLLCWMDFLPLEITFNILKFCCKNNGYNSVVVYKCLRLVNRSFNSLIAPMLLNEYAKYLDSVVSQLQQQDKIPEMRIKLNGIQLKGEEKQQAIRSLWKLQSSMSQQEFSKILMGLSSLWSEYWILGDIAKQIQIYKKNQFSQTNSKWISMREDYDYYHRGSTVNDFPNFSREPEEFRRDRLPPGPNIPLIEPPIPQSGGNAPTFWGEPDPDHERRLGRDESIPGIRPPNYIPNSTSPFGTALPPPNPYKPPGGNRGLYPRFN